MPIKIKNKLIRKHEVKNVGTFHYYDNLMISELKEGIIVDLDVVLEVTNKLTNKYYGTTIPFVYISNRVNSYSIQPTVHIDAKKLAPNVKGYAVIGKKPFHAQILEIEKLFLDIPAKIFDNLTDAVAWANKLVLNSK